MKHATFSPFPHLSWLGAWNAFERKRGGIDVELRQVNHCLIYDTGSNARVRWIHGGREDRFEVRPGTVRFYPADDAVHAFISTCDAGYRSYMLFVPRWHLTSTVGSEGIATVPEFRHSLSYRDAVLTVCMRTLSGDGGDGMASSPEVQEAAALSLILRIMSMNGFRAPDWTNDTSVFSRQALTHLVDYIDSHLCPGPSLGDMAMTVGMSPSHFAKKFRRSTGLSPLRFVNQRRIRRGLVVLQESSSPLASVALQLGFSSHGHFTRAFTATMGITPTRYRQQFMLHHR